MSPSPFPAPSSFKRASGSKPRNLTRCWSVPELYLYSPFFLASVARPLSSIRGRITNPPRRTWKLRGGRWVKSVGAILVFILFLYLRFVGSGWPALFGPSWRHIRCPDRTPHSVPSRQPLLLCNVPYAHSRVGIRATPVKR